MSKDTIHVFNNLSIKGLVANGYVGSAGQALLSNGSGAYWGSGAGFTGSRGDLGYTGSQGDIGFTGSQGVIGFTGSQGDIGYTGSKGDIGFTGSASTVIGYTGSQGDIGFTGSASTVIGYTGSQGDIGYTGSKGDTGFTGSASTVVGYTGSQGDVGYTGSKGDTGFTGSASTVVGYTGSKGDIGFTGSASTVIGYTGSKGDVGFTGSASTVVGYTGSKGDIGFTGSASTVIGYTGSKGDIGFTGSASTVIGYTGSQGPAGPAALPQNPTGTTYGNGVSTVPTYMLSQAVGDSDGWRLYGEAPESNQVRMVFELTDDIEEALTDQWVFRNKRTYTDYVARNEFNVSGTGESYSRTSSRAPIFYDSANTAFYIDAASTSNLNGLTVAATITGSVSGTAGSISGFNNPTTAPTGSTIAYRDAAGDIAAREIVLSSGLSAETPTVLTSMYPTTNQLVRTTPGAVAVAIRGAASGSWGINITGSAAGCTFTEDSVNKDDMTTRTDSGFYQSVSGTTAEGWPVNSGGWQHLISCTHTNDANYYAMQLGATFFDQGLFYRSTNGSGATAWSRVALYDNAYSGELRATIFRDNDNTGYYLNPAETSYINALNIGPTAAGASYLNINGYNAYGGTGYHGFLTIYNTYESATNPYQYWRLNAAGGWEIINSPYNAVLFTFTQGGDFTAAGNVTAYSDRKLKANFKPIENALSKVLQLNGVTFTRIDKEDTTKRYAGLLAQDVEAALPEAVQSNETMSYGEVKSVDYNGTIALLVEAIKEQQAHINRLQEQINRG